MIRGVAFAGGGYAITQVLTLAFYLVLARLATPEDFGQLAAGTILVGFGLLFTESGMLAAVVQRRDRVEEAAATAVIATLAAGFGGALLALAISPLVGDFFNSGTVAAVAAATSGLLLLRTTAVVPSALLQRRFSFVRRVVVEPAGVIAFGATAIVATTNGLGVWGLVLGHYASAISDVVLSWTMVRWRPKLRLASFAIWRELISYGRHVFVSNAIHRAGAEVPVVLIGRFIGTPALGQYRYAYRIAATPFATMLAGAAYVIFPAFARISHDPPRLRAAFERALRWMATLGIPGGLILVPLGVPLAALLFGEVWRFAGEAAMALCLVPAAGAIFSVVSEAFTANGRPELLIRMVLVQMVSAIAAMFALLSFGLVGVAAGVSIGGAAGALYGLRLANRVIGTSWRAIGGEILPAVLAAGTMATVMFPVEHLLLHAADRPLATGLPLLAAEGVACIAIYLTVLHLISPGRLSEFVGLIRHAARSRGSRGPTTESGGEQSLDDPMTPR